MALDPALVKEAPEKPGVYLFKDEKGEVLYVGKAKNIKKRLQNYLRLEAVNTKTRVLISKTKKIETIVARSEKEALLLEANLIKRYRPRYNILLRDDKAYPLLRISMEDPFPGIRIVRKKRKDKALYFGPYPSAGAVRKTLKFLGRLFPLRRCSLAEFKRREKPCLYHQIGRCPAPCVGKISPEEYQRLVEGMVLFLRGKGDKLVRGLKREMKEASEKLEFERAAVLRDRIRAIEKTIEAQMVALNEEKDLDIFYVVREKDKVSGTILFVRAGALIGKKTFHLSRAHEDEAALYSSLLTQFYDENKYIPQEILLPVEPESQKIIEEWLTELAGHRVQIKVPQRGRKKSLLVLARKNALEALASRIKGERPYAELSEVLAQSLRLPKPPFRVEGVDISNLQGTLPVGAVVSFWEGQPDKTRYRLYHLRTVPQPDDYAMIYETVFRHLRHAQEEGLPDLLLIDGGKGQLQAALTAAEELGLLGKLSFCALAKEREGQGEKIYLPQRKNPLLLVKHNEVLRFLQRVRDEAHRFAVSAHRRRRRTTTLRSVLDEIPGVGPKRKKTLLQYFEGLEGIKKAPLEEIASLPGFNRKVAQEVKRFLESKDEHL